MPMEQADAGVLVMAHGGTDEWNASVEEAVKGAGDDMTAVVAFGMAEPSTMQKGLDSLGALGVERVAVVRLFVSGTSFYTQTAYLLGLSDEKPAFFMTHANMMAMRERREAESTGAAVPRHRPEEPAPLAHDLTIATHDQGLMGSPEVNEIILSRALDVSKAPSQESVLILAHGMGDEAENEQLLAAMEGAAERVRGGGFAQVGVDALREDWPEARALAEEQIRDFVLRETVAGRSVIVVPYRLSGFGPYAAVLEGLEYIPTEGLLPHEAISDWVRHTALKVMCQNGWPETTACALRTQ